MLLDIHIAVVDIGADLDSLAVGAIEHTSLLEDGEVLADSYLRYIEQDRQLGHTHLPFRLHLARYKFVTFCDIHSSKVLFSVKIRKKTKTKNRRHTTAASVNIYVYALDITYLFSHILSMLSAVIVFIYLCMTI